MIVEENREPLISIIVPAYNASLTIRKTIDSVLNQIYQNWELIIINDGSQDDTLKICRTYKDLRISVIDKDNGGPSSARNAGLKYCKGEYVCFVDSDDWIEPEYLNLLYRSIVNYQSDLSVCGLVLSRNNSFTNLSLQVNTCYQCLYKNQEFIKVFETGLLNSPCNKLYKKAIIDHYSIRFKPLFLVEDIEFNIQYFRYVSKVSFIKDSLYHYEQDNSHQTIRVSKDAFDNYLQIHRLLLGLVDREFYIGVDRFVYHQYMSIIIKYLIKAATGKLPPKKVFILLKHYMSNSLIKRAFDGYKPLSVKESIVYGLIKRHCFFVVMLFLKIKSK